jgi:CRISPR-associated protein Cmr3
MSTQYFSITPQDAWFFRDGRPYNHAESNQADVESVFPPSARTLTGAVRAALARANGWDGQPRGWPAKVTEAFGSGPNDLGKLQFSGPFLLRDGQSLWPIPRHLLGRSEGGCLIPKAFLRPDTALIETDQGKRNLPKITLPPGEKRDGPKPAEVAWITTVGLSQILVGHVPSPDAVLEPTQLWQFESRVGLKRDDQTHKVGEGDLYSPSYIRLCRGVALGGGLTGVRVEMKCLPELFPLGGESRLAQCDPWNGDPLPKAPRADSFKSNAEGRVEFAIILLTPGRLADPTSFFSGARLISACVGKSVPIGGWDSLNNEPLPLEPFHPAGSAWFCDAPADEFHKRIHGQHGHWIGSHIAHGFGQIVIGNWPSTTDGKNKS